MTNEVKQEEPVVTDVYPHGIKLILILVSLYLSMFLVALVSKLENAAEGDEGENRIVLSL